MDKDFDNKSEDLRRGRMEYLKLAAHQLKSPLFTIQTSLRTILDGFTEPLTSAQQKILEGVEHKTRESIRLLEDILHLARMERVTPADFRPVDLAALTEEILAHFEEESRNKKLLFEVHVPQKLPRVSAYEAGLRQIVGNLLDNAFKYTPRQGKVEFYLSYDPSRSLLRGRVADNGMGIPEKEREKIFEEFYRASNVGRLRLPGTGLGMSIISRAVRVHQGKLSLKSGPGEGTRVDFELPLRPAPRADEKKEEEEPSLRIVVIGGVAAGPKAAAKARRMDHQASITIVERGEFLSYSGCGLPYYISGKVRDQGSLMTTVVGVYRDPEYFQRIKNIRVLNKTEAVAIDRPARKIKARDLSTGREFEIPYDKLVVTTGASSRFSSLPGWELQNIFTLHRIRDAEGLRAILQRGTSQEAVIIGGGLIGTETAEALAERGARVTVVEALDQILPMLDREIAGLVERHMEVKGVRVLTGEPVLSFLGEGKVKAVKTFRRELPADFVLIATGVKPNVELARRAGLELGPTGAIKVNRYLRTSDPDIYAGGDCVENLDLVTGQPVYMPLGSTANKHGRVIGINVAGGKETFPGITTTTILKVFDYNVSKVGLCEKEAAAAGFRTVTSICPSPDREHFYPGSRMILTKLVADAATGRVLGVQVVGTGEVSKRVDVAAALIFKRGTVEDLSKLDLAYAPPYSEAIDCLIQAANIIKNKLSGCYRWISPLELKARLASGAKISLVDLRTPAEYEGGSIPGSRLIPLGSLSGRLDELGGEEEIVLICGTGIQSYEAALLLQDYGVSRVRALDGGLAAWPFERR